MGSWLAARTVLAQGIGVRDLPKPTREIDDPFSMVSGVVEHRSGRLVVADALEGVLAVVDFRTGSKTAIGRQGSGPGEYRALTAIVRRPGDSLWVFDALQMRVVAFNPDMGPGVGFSFMTFDQSTSTALAPPFLASRDGTMYAGAMPFDIRAGTSARMPDSLAIVRFDARGSASARTTVGRVRFASSGTPEMKQSGDSFKYSLAYAGLVPPDLWTVFADGRVAIVRGATYTVEFLSPDGKRSPPARIPFQAIPVTVADRNAELIEAKRMMLEQGQALRRSLPAGVTMTFEILPPAEWPSHYPAVASGALAAPDGHLWIRRATPSLLRREQWDVVDTAGRLVARWRLPLSTTLVAVGLGVAYTVRTDGDNLRYVQRVELARKVGFRSAFGGAASETIGSRSQ